MCLVFTEHMQDILGLLFKYIQLLQQTGVCQWIFDEVWLCQLFFILTYSNDSVLKDFFNTFLVITEARSYL